MSFPQGTEMFHFPWCRPDALCIQTPVSRKRDGFPHSEISGSKRICRSPKLNAAYHVLLRLPMPRHPPCALTSLIKSKLFSPTFPFTSRHSDAFDEIA